MNGVSLDAGQYVLREDPANNQYVIQKISGGSLGAAVNLTNSKVQELWNTYPDKIGGYVEYYTMGSVNGASLSAGNYAITSAPAMVYTNTGGFLDAHTAETTYYGLMQIGGLEKEGVSNSKPVVYLTHDDIDALNGAGNNITEEGYYEITVTPGTGVTSISKVVKGDTESPTFGSPGTAITTLGVTESQAYEHIFGSHYVIGLETLPASVVTSGTIEELSIGWDVVEANLSNLQTDGGSPANPIMVMVPSAVPLTLTNAGTDSDIEGTPIRISSTYDPTASPDSLSAQHGIFIGPSSSGDYYDFTTDTTHSTTALNGSYVIVNYGTDHYTAYELTGNGDLDSPYEISHSGIYLDKLTDSGWVTLYNSGSGAAGTYNQAADLHNVYQFSAGWTDADSGLQVAGYYAFYEKFTSGVSDGIFAKAMNGDGTALASSAAEIRVGNFSDFATLVASLDASKYFNAGGGIITPPVTPPASGPVGSWHDGTSQTLDLDTAIYALSKETHGVSADGLYVLTGTDVTDLDAFLVTGNQQVGYNVAETADTEELALTLANLTAVGELDVRIVSIVAGDSIAGDDTNPLTGNYALILNGTTSNFDAYEVSTQANGNFILGDKVKSAIFADATAVNDSALPTVGYLDSSTATDYVGTADQAIFEIEQVAGGRYGNIITYGVKLIDGDYGENATLTSAMFNLSWTSVDGDPDYAYWGEFTPTNGSPNTLNYASVPQSSFTPATFFTTVGDTGLSFGMFNDAGMTYGAGDYVATFMLEKTNSLALNDLKLTTAQYTLYDAYDTVTNVTPEEQALTTNTFSFAPHDMTLKLKTANGEEVPGVELMVTNLATNDGLSIVPVLRNGDIIQYQLVMNVPIPSFIQKAADPSVQINPYHKIVITGADIFDSSISWLTALGGGETGSLIRNLTDKSVILGETNDVSASVAVAAPATYTGHEFLDLVLGTSDIEADLSTSSKLTFELENLKIPELAMGTAAVDAEGRYILAEFSANVASTISFTASQKADLADQWTAGAARTITRSADGSYRVDQTSQTTPGWVQISAIDDGSEVVALAEGWYMNERQANDAIGAEDALGALRVSRDSAVDPANNIYSQPEIIAADFNLDGKVTAADAYDILQFAVSGPDSVSGTAKWVYIDDIANNGATASMVHYDNVTDTFVGSATTINATAVLIGDVTSSYSGPGTTSAVGAYIAWLEDLAEKGISNLVSVDSTETAANVFAADATGADIVYVGDDPGIHTITNYDGASQVIVLGHKADALRGGTLGQSVEVADAAAAKAGATTQFYGGADVAVMTISTTDKVYAFDLDGNGAFNETADLMIIASGATIDFADDPNSVATYTTADWV